MNKALDRLYNLYARYIKMANICYWNGNPAAEKMWRNKAELIRKTIKVIEKEK